ncbi:MAG: phage tail tape measure protein [Campylobacteraceae bacterium]|jgi:TP901 family phage tail tape measure protein|nr:phage tail tape measure protein [Campylobacteraceae bacterium]
MKDIAVGITLGLAVSGLREFMNTNKSFDALRKLAKQTDAGVKGLSATLVSYRKNLVKIDAAQRKMTDAKNQLFNMKNLIMGGAIAAPFKLAIDYESAMADVSKVVDFANKEEESLFANQIKHLTRDIPLAATDLAAIAAAGGQMGIAKEQLLDFTKITAKMSTAFDMSADEAGESIGKIMNVYKLSIEEAESLGDAMNHLSDNSASKARQIVEVMQRIGGNAKVFGLASEEAAALSSTMLSLGKSPEVAGTTINRLLSVMATAPKQGKQFQDALVKIGIDAETLKETIETNPQAAITDFLERLSDVDKAEQMGVFTDIMGQGFADDLAVLVGGIDQYSKAMGNVTDKSKYAGSMQREFEKRSATTANQIQLMKSAISEIGITFGSIFLPALNKALSAIRAIAYPIANFIENHKTLAKAIGGVIIGLFSFKVLLLSSKIAFFWAKANAFGFWNALKFVKVAVLAATGAIKKHIIGINLASLRLKAAIIATYLYGRAVSFLKFAFTGLLGGLKAILIGIRVFSIALLTTPLGWIILGITAVIAAVIFLYKKFAWFRDFVGMVWEAIKNAFAWSPLGLLMKGFGAAFDWLASKFEWVNSLVEYFSSLWDSIKGIFSDIAGWFGFGGDNEVEVTNEEADVYADNSYNYGGYGAPARVAQTSSGSTVTVNFSGNLMIGSKPDGTFDFNQFKQELIKATKDALKKDAQNADNRRID